MSGDSIEKNQCGGNNDDIEKMVLERLNQATVQTEQQTAPQDNCPYSSDEIISALYDNESGDARLLIDLLKNKFIYDHPDKQWYYWNDHFWRRDIKQNVFKSIDKLVEIYGTERNRQTWQLESSCKNGNDTSSKKNINNIKQLTKRMTLLQTSARRDSVLKFLRNGVDTLGMVGNWDDKKHVLVCKNGTVDLRTGEIAQNKPEDFVRKTINIAWQGFDQPCITWDQFLIDIFGGNIDLIDYIQRLFGYMATGTASEHIFPIFYGENGRNGKGTMIETIKNILGDYAVKLPHNFLMRSKLASSEAPPNPAILMLQGARMTWCSESDDNQTFDNAKIKEMTGGDSLSARGINGKNYITFQPTHTLFMMTNSKPKTAAYDSAMWQRIHLIEFNVSFVDDPQKPHERQRNNKLFEMLKSEYHGILAWIVNGAMKYYESGLKVPEIVKSKTMEYQNEENNISEFIDECCVIDDSFNCKTSDFRERYNDFCKKNDYTIVNRLRILKEMDRLGYKTRKIHGNSKYLGLTLLDL